MSDEILRRLTESAAAHGVEADSRSDVAHIAASIIGPARRRRRVRGAVTVTAAMVAVAAFAGGSFAALDAYGSKDANPVAVLSTPSLSNLATPEPTVGATPSAVTDPDDGIDVYPPLARSRGKGFPVAYEMHAWVWDHVDAGWSLQSYSQSPDPYGKPVVVPEAIIYLVSPEGAAFEVQAAPVEFSAGLRVVSWQEDDRTAHIEWGDLKGVTSTGGGELDLNTGTVSPLVFTTPWGASSTVAPMAVTATGNELWAAWLGGHVRYYHFGTAEGWTVATVNDLISEGDLNARVRWGVPDGAALSGSATRSDGRAVVFEHRTAGGAASHDAPTRIAVYDVDADLYSTVDVNLGTNGGCTLTKWSAGDALEYECSKSRDAISLRLPDAPDFGAVLNTPADQGDGSTGYGVRRTGTVGFGEAPSRAALFPPTAN